VSETDEPYVIEMENGPDIVAYSAGEVAYLQRAAAGNAWLLEPGAEDRLRALLAGSKPDAES
jgi:hypothetical protein